MVNPTIEATVLGLVLFPVEEDRFERETRRDNIRFVREVVTEPDAPTKPFSSLDLRDAALVGLDLSDAELIDTDLSGADLGGANLNNAHLGGANLHDAGLAYADLSGAQLRGADLSDAFLYETDLSGADLSDVHLSSVDLRDADPSHVYLSGADVYGPDVMGPFDEMTGNDRVFSAFHELLRVMHNALPGYPNETRDDAEEVRNMYREMYSR